MHIRPFEVQNITKSKKGNINSYFKVHQLTTIYAFSTTTKRYSTLLSLGEFEDQYISGTSDKDLFDKIRDILRLTKTDTHMQRRIEKLFNMYLLSKEEASIKLNPLWSNKLFEVFFSEYETFELSWNKSLSNLKFNLFEPWNLNDLFNSQLIFFVSIVKYLSLLDANSDCINIKKATVVATVVDELYELLSPIFELYFFMHVFGPELLKTELPSNNVQLIKPLGEIKSERADTELLRVMRFKYKTCTHKSSIYLRTLKQFEKRYTGFKANISLFLTQITEHAYRDLEECNVFMRSKYSTGGKTYDYLEVFDISMFNKVRVICYMSSQLPMIVQPLDWDLRGKRGGFLLNRRSNDSSLTSGLSRGNSSLHYSKYTLDSINRLQKKKYRVNKEIYEYIQGEVFKRECGIMDTKTLYGLYIRKHSLCTKLRSYFSSTEDFSLMWSMYKSELSSLMSGSEYKKSTRENRARMVTDTRKKYNITEEFINNLNAFREAKKVFFHEINKYTNHSYILRMSNVFKSKNLYFVTNLDFRTRFFPVGRGPHRASGPYKYLLTDRADWYIHDSKSIIWLKQFISLKLFKHNHEYSKTKLIEEFDAYFSQIVYAKSINEIKEYLLTGIVTSKLTEKIDDSEESYLLSLGVLDYLRSNTEYNYLSSLCLDVDQCSSGPMIYSLLSRDRYMGKLTNALPTSIFKEDLYWNFLNKLKEKVTTSAGSNKLLLELKTDFDNLFDRNFSKELLMPTFFNMGLKGKYNFIYRHLLTRQVTINVEKKANLILKFVSETLISKYSNTVNYQQSLVQICKKIRRTDAIHIKTLDGSLISYSYLNPHVRYGRIYRCNKPLKYRIYNQIGVPDSKKEYSYNHYWSFPPNYIHSLDGSICRMICYIYSNKFSRELEPLHDSFRIPLNRIHSLLSVIKFVYMYFFFNEYWSKHRMGISYEGILEKESIHHDNDRTLLPTLPEPFDFDILRYTFLDQLATTIDEAGQVAEVAKCINVGPAFTEEESEQFFKSEFMFYF